jgi:hypothetical protein
MKPMSLPRWIGAPLLLALLQACGGGGGGGSSASAPPVTTPTPLTAGAHTLGISLSASGTVPVSGVTLSLTLPTGFTVDVANGATGAIADASLTAGTALASNAILSGTWSASSRQAKVVVVHAPAAVWSGEALRLKVTVPSGSTTTEADLQALNAAPAGLKVVGYDTTAHSTVSLTAQSSTSLRVLN